MADSGFSQDGKYFAINNKGRLRIWDTETNTLKQEFTPDLHLTLPPTCIHWLSVAISAKSAVSADFPPNLCLALGTASGSIHIYCLASGKVETVLTDSTMLKYRKKISGKNREILAIDWSKRHGLFSGNPLGHVIEWDLNTTDISYDYALESSDRHITALKILNHRQRYVVTAVDTQLKLWLLNRGREVCVKNFGHPSTPRSFLHLAQLGKKVWLIEGSSNERLLTVWDASLPQGDINDEINLDDDTNSMEVDSTLMTNGGSPKKNPNTPTKESASTPRKEGEVESQSDVQDTPNLNDGGPKKKRKRKKPITETIEVPEPMYNFVMEDAPKSIDVMVQQKENGIQFNLAAATRSGVVHYYGHFLNGSLRKPLKPLVTVQVTTEDATPLQLYCCKLSPDRDEGHLLIGYEVGRSRITFETVTPDLDKRTQVLIREDLFTKGQKKVATVGKGGDDVTYAETGAYRKRAEPGAKVEVPMEERLANLALDLKSRNKSAVNQNLTKLLIQGLHSKDKNLITSVLSCADPQVADSTLSCLPASYAPALLDFITDMATKKTTLCVSSCVWLLSLLRCQSALLLSTPQGDALANLLTVYTQRRSHLCQLLNLKGRLHLTQTQRQPHTQQDMEPQLQYNDTSSEDEMQVQSYQSDDGSWDEDKFESYSDEKQL